LNDSFVATTSVAVRRVNHSIADKVREIHRLGLPPTRAS
jgi:hypothetical protein